MEHVAIRQLRDGLASYIHRVRGGESLLVIDGDAPVALLTPADDARGGRAFLAGEGVVDWSTGKPRGATHPAAVRCGTVADLVVGKRR